MKKSLVGLACIIALLCFSSFFPFGKTLPSDENPEKQSSGTVEATTSNVKDPVVLITRTGLEGKEDGVIDAANQSDEQLRLISRAGVEIGGLWIRRAGSWSVIRLDTPGVVGRRVIDGAELIAPVGHLPERPSSGGDFQSFSAWARLVVKGAPDNWAQSASAVAPVLPHPKDAWQLISSGMADQNVWTCLVQPSKSMLKEPTHRLSKVRFPFELQVNGIPEMEIEISLARGAVLVLDYQDLLQQAELIDVPVHFRGLPHAVKWNIHVVENSSKNLDSYNPTLVNVAAGRVVVPTSGQRHLTIDSKTQCVIPGVRVGSRLSLLASSSDNRWFAFHAGLEVRKNSTIDLSVERGLTLVVKGLGGYAEGMPDTGSLNWWFALNGVKQDARAQAIDLRPDETGQAEVQLIPSIWQMYQLEGASVTSMKFEFRISREGMAATGSLDIPVSREMEYELKMLESETSTLIVKRPFSEIQGVRYVTIASDHESHEEHNQCGIWLPVSEVRPGMEKGETEVVLVGEESYAFSQKGGGIPNLLVFDWEESSRYYSAGADGKYRGIPMVTVECDFFSQAVEGTWTISWAFGCEKNLAFPLSLPLEVGMLPARITLLIPRDYSILLANKKRIERIGEYSPIRVELELDNSL